MNRDWTLDETLIVRDFAGTVSLQRLAAFLHRPLGDVAGECSRLGVPFVYVGTPLQWCIECASWTGKLTKSGNCPKCNSRRLIQGIESRTADLLAKLPPEERAVYDDTEAERATIVWDAPPVAPDTSEMPPREAVVVYTAYLAARSAWEAENEYRRRRAAQKRKERIAYKVRVLEGGA